MFLGLLGCNDIFGVPDPREDIEPFGPFSGSTHGLLDYAVPPGAEAGEPTVAAESITYRSINGGLFAFGTRDQLWLVPVGTGVQFDQDKPRTYRSYPLPKGEGNAYLGVLEEPERTGSDRGATRHFAVLRVGTEGLAHLRLATFEQGGPLELMPSFTSSSVVPNIRPMASGHVHMWMGHVDDFHDLSERGLRSVANLCRTRMALLTSGTTTEGDTVDSLLCTSTADGHEAWATAVRCQCVRRSGTQYIVDSGSGILARGAGDVLHAAEGLQRPELGTGIGELARPPWPARLFGARSLTQIAVPECLTEWVESAKDGLTVCGTKAARAGIYRRSAGPVLLQSTRHLDAHNWLVHESDEAGSPQMLAYFDEGVDPVEPAFGMRRTVQSPRRISLFAGFENTPLSMGGFKSPLIWQSPSVFWLEDRLGELGSFVGSSSLGGQGVGRMGTYAPKLPLAPSSILGVGQAGSSGSAGKIYLVYPTTFVVYNTR